MAAFAALKLALERLRVHRDTAPRDHREWERLFTSSLGWLDLLITCLPDRARKAGVMLASVVPWEAYESEARGLMSALHDRFTALRSGGPELGRLLAGRPDSDKLWVWTDCMRWDVLNHIILSGPSGDGPEMEVVDGGFTWARTPTVTDVQVEGVSKALGHPVEFAPLDPRGPFLPPPVLHRSDLIDDKVHTSRDDYPLFLDECLLGWRRKIEPFLLATAREGVQRVLLVSDHGYRINHSFRPERKHEQPRYLHGKDTPQEVLAPWAEVLVRARP